MRVCGPAPGFNRFLRVRGLPPFFENSKIEGQPQEIHDDLLTALGFASGRQLFLSAVFLKPGFAERLEEFSGLFHID